MTGRGDGRPPNTQRTRQVPEINRSVSTLLKPANIRVQTRGGMFSNRLVRELALVLAIKLIALFALWLAFFSDPVTPRLSADTVSETIIGGSTHSRPVLRHADK